MGFSAEVYIVGVLSLLTTAEMYSIVQNIYTVHTGKKLSEYDAISAAIAGIGQFFVVVIETMLEKFKRPPQQ